MGPVRDLGAAVASVKLERIRPIQMADFQRALAVSSRLVGLAAQLQHVSWPCRLLLSIATSCFPDPAGIIEARLLHAFVLSLTEGYTCHGSRIPIWCCCCRACTAYTV